MTCLFVVILTSFSSRPCIPMARNAIAPSSMNQSLLCRQPLTPSQYLLNFAPSFTMIFGCESLAMALLLPSSGWHWWLRMAMDWPAQVACHKIDHHAYQHQNHADPHTPITMRPFPVRTRNVPVHKSELLVASGCFFDLLPAFRMPSPIVIWSFFIVRHTPFPV